MMKYLSLTVGLVAMFAAQSFADSKPNILWITIEDWSPDLSCYGTKGVQTPNVDRLASEGIRYTRAFTTSPVCSTSRSAMMTGFHQNYIGAHQHRTDDKKPLPYGIRPIPHLMADAGYFTAVMSWKTDCNFLPDTKEELFQGKDWSERKEGQPFFARITFQSTHRAWKRDPQRPIPIEDVELPPYYADTPFIRRDWANGLEQMQLVDREVGALLKRLEDEGLAENTIVFFIADHGRCHIRGKQFLYDEGTRIPMIVRWPGKVAPGQVNGDLVYSIDLCATALEVAGVEAPVALHGQSLFGDEVKNREYVFAARDKMDDSHDAMRSIRSKDHKLILNLMPERAYCQFSHYKEGAYPPLAEMNVLNLQGKLTPEQAAFMAPNKPEIEMFDLKKDPHEVKNVADDPAYADIKAKMLKELEAWRENVIRDQGVSEAFRAKGLFPEKCPTPTVGEWVEKNVKNYNFTLNGSPPWFPTRTLDEWIKVRDMWKPYVFRGPEEKVARPVIPFTKKAKKKKGKTPAVPIWSSPSMSSFSGPQLSDLDVALTGRDLYLVVDALEDGKNDWADWIAPTITMADGSERSLVEMGWKSATAGKGKVRIDRSGRDTDLTVEGTLFPKGIGTHSPSVIHFRVPKGARRLTGKVGADQVGGGTMRFHVFDRAPADPFVSIPEKMKAAASAVPVRDFQVPDDLEVTVWATSPMFFNPTNMDTDAQGRIWVAEGVNYRRTLTRPEGDRIMVLEDTDLDGKADSSHVFVQDPELISPLGISVFDNQIVVAQPPHIIVYTDVDRDLKFDPAIDKRENLLSGFNGRNHDHSLHATIAGPDGKWYFNQGNCGAQFTDKDGRVFQSGGPYYKSGGGKPEWFNDTREYAGKPSADGNIYQGGIAGRMNPDGSGVQIIGHGFRNSYELCLSSFGDVFQNDNDDPPACRNTWLMEGGNLGFFSNDGTRTWQADRRPGQSIAVAHWRQEDPGSLPAGDIYGPGSPTGVVFYEDGALPEKYEGMFLSCEARARLIQRYHPKLSETGAAMELGERTNLLTCDDNPLFRPADVMVGADGALYLADWFDSGVGGHRAADATHSGTIYRIAPKGFKPVVMKSTKPIDLLKNPSPSVRFAGFQQLKAAGDDALDAVVQLINSENRWHAARGVWLLPHLGAEGLKKCQERLGHADPEQRILAFRALRSARQDVIAMGQELVKDPSAAVRRELAVALRDLAPEKKLPLVVALFEKFDGADRHYLEACGLAAEEIEDAVWAAIAEPNSLNWESALIWSAWRLTPAAAVPELRKRAAAGELSERERVFAMESLAFIGNEEAVGAIVELAKVEGKIGEQAQWWLLNRGLDDWAKFGVKDLLKEQGIYDPEKVVVQPITVPLAPETKLPPLDELMKLEGNAVNGKLQAMRCVMCHRIDGQGVDYGPALNGWVANQGKKAFFEAVVYPSRGIAHGYTGSTIFLKEGGAIDGLIYSSLDPVVIASTGGVQQLVPRDRIKGIKKRKASSLMLSADQLGFTEQDLADLAAYLQDY